MSSIPLVAVAAIGRNGALGRDNRLPWSMPSDLARFRAVTMGKPMIMGRRTFESIGRVLPGRESIVVTRASRPAATPGLFHAASPEAALVLARERARVMGASEVINAGGATLFGALMPVTDRLCLTVVDLAPEADVFFPAIDPSAWREAGRVAQPRGPRDDAACWFLDYIRRRTPA